MFGRLKTGLDGVVTAVSVAEERLKGLGNLTDKAAREVENAAGSISSSVEGAERRVEESAGRIRERARDLQKDTADAFDDLFDVFENAQNQFDEDLKLQLEAVRAGGKDVEDLLRLYGDAKVKIGDELKTIRKILDGADFGQFEDRIQELMQFVRDQSSSLEEVISRVGELGGMFADQIVEMLRKFREGKITFDELQNRMEALQRRFPDSDLDNLLDEIRDRIQGGERDGFI